VFCEKNCNWSCHDVDRCGAVVGDGSEVQCTRTSSCEVECKGECRVDCNNTAHCDVTCRDGSPTIKCGNGRLACGSCA
jgi:hypothetical protein